MFNHRRKSECHRIREMFSPYLDGCVTSVERDAVKYHIEICEDCEWELRSLGSTVQLLSRMPAACAPRSFTLAKAPPRRDWLSFAIPSMNRLRVATALAVVLLAILLTGDLSGLFHGAIIEPVVEDRVPIAEPGETLALVAEDPPKEIDRMPEAEEPVPSEDPPEDRRIAQKIEGDPLTQVPEGVPPLDTGIPEAPLPVREPYPWLQPLQIASTALVLILGGANILVWRRKRAYSC